MLVVLLSPSLFAQGSQGAITGTVADPSNAFIPGARIEARHLATNTVVTTVTNDSGSYVLPFIPAGQYSITVSSSGFKTLIRHGVQLNASDRLQLDLTLELGVATEQVTVSAEADQLETATASRGQVLQADRIRDLPLVGRNPYQQAALSAGAYFNNPSPDESSRPMEAGVAVSLNGAGGYGQNMEVLINGMTNTGPGEGLPAHIYLMPSPDAVEELTVRTNVYDAQYGRTGGGYLSLVLKSGTNNFHGALYHYFRNDLLSANRFESNLLGAPKARFLSNTPGVQFDGPVRLPGIYDGRNRTFFMYSWEAVRVRYPNPVIGTVPTLEQRAGDFSRTVQQDGQPILVYDPLTTQQIGDGFTRQPFVGNRIPTSRIDPVAQKMLEYIPPPNSAGNVAGFFNYGISPNSRGDTYDQHIIRIDQVLTDRHRLFVSWFRNINHETVGTAGFKREASLQYSHWRGNHGGQVDSTYIISPSRVLNSRIGFQRHPFAIERHGDGFNPLQLGFPQALVSQLPRLAFPRIDISDYLSFGAGASNFTFSNTLSLSETLSQIVGPHALKVGGEFRNIRSNQNSPTSTAGSYSFTKGYTQRDPLRAEASAGNAFASMLLGYPDSGAVNSNIASAYQFLYYALFLQDDWRVSSKLSLNLGFRWDYESPITERFNRQNRGFDGNADNPFQVPGLKLKGGLLFTDPSNRLPYERDFNNFQIRIGAAYQLTPKLVFRGGYGSSYLPTFDTGFSNGYSVATPFVSSQDGGLTPADRLQDPYPAGLLIPPGESAGLATLVGRSFSFGFPERQIPRMDQFSAGFQRQLPWDILVDGSYVGTRGHHLFTSRNINELTPELLGLGTSLLVPVANPFQGLLPGTPFNGPAVPAQQLLRPFPQFASITQAKDSNGSSWYNSMQIQLRKRLSNGLQFQISYTWAKLLAATSYLSPQNRRGDLERVIGNEAPQYATVAVSYEVPFFKSKRGVTKQLLSGWAVQLVAMKLGGRTTINTPAGAYSTGIDPKLPDNQRSRERWFNTCTVNQSGLRQNCATPETQVAWTVQPPFTLRTLSTRFSNIRTLSPPNVDLSVFKQFTLREPVRIQFRAEAYNFLNTPEFGSPNTILESSNFGVVTPRQINTPRIIQLSLRLIF